MGRAHEVRAASMAKTAAAKSKLNNKWGKIIYLAAKSGVPDPAMNQTLKREIEKAKKEQCSADVIARSIAKAAGGTSGQSYSEARYEVFAQGGSTLIIECLTDNVNRTVADLKTAINKCGAKLGQPGTVMFKYNHYGVLSFSDLTEDEALEAFLGNDCDIVDIKTEDDFVTVYTEPANYTLAKESLLAVKEDLEFEDDGISYVPTETIELNDEDLAKFNRLLSMLSEIDDVQDTYHNVSNLPEEEE